MQVRELLAKVARHRRAAVRRGQPGCGHAFPPVGLASVPGFAPVAGAGDGALKSRHSTGVDRDGLEVPMRSHKFFPALAPLLLALVAGPAFADGRWTVSMGVGQSVSELHGSAIEAAAYAQLHPLLGLGLECGMAYMQIHRAAPIYFPVEPNMGAAGQLASLTDGLTRNRGLFVGPALRVGQQLYALASAGVY